MAMWDMEMAIAGGRRRGGSELSLPALELEPGRGGYEEGALDIESTDTVHEGWRYIVHKYVTPREHEPNRLAKRCHRFT